MPRGGSRIRRVENSARNFLVDEIFDHFSDIPGPRRLANLVIHYIQGFSMKARAQNCSGEAVAVCAI
jgi:hypothetical protein